MTSTVIVVFTKLLAISQLIGIIGQHSVSDYIESLMPHGSKNEAPCGNFDDNQIHHEEYPSEAFS